MVPLASSRGAIREHVVGMSEDPLPCYLHPPWAQAQSRGLMRDCAMYINGNYEVDQLCRCYPDRLNELARITKAGRLRY